MAVVKRDLSVISYNMHGFNQGFSTARDLSLRYHPDIILIQEHWLLPANFTKINQLFPNYFTFGSYAANNTESGFARGRPSGGLAILIANEMQAHPKTLHSSERCCIIKLFDCIIIVNLYLPCVGTVDRIMILDEVINEVANVFELNANCTFLVGGDLNCDLDSDSDAAKMINSFSTNFGLKRCDDITGYRHVTYVNTALNHSSCVDYILTSDPDSVHNFDVIDEGSNLSDHLPLVMRLQCNITEKVKRHSIPAQNNESRQTYLRWDHADLASFYSFTGSKLQCLLDEILKFETLQYVNSVDADTFIEHTYNAIVEILNDLAKLTVPRRSKNFYKFWWCAELDCLKSESIEAHRLWISAGRPRTGSIACQARSAKLRYKNEIRKCQKQEMTSYTNDLHDALVQKDGTTFWKVWKSKFDSRSNKITVVDGLSDAHSVAAKFADHFESCCCSSVTADGSSRLENVYHAMRDDYNGMPFDDIFTFDVELVDDSIRSLKRGKAAGLDELSAEHLIHCHPALCTVLKKLFNTIIKYGRVPSGFGLSYTVPLPKNNSAAFNKSLTVEDFRGISISPVISKVFEKCILDRYISFLQTSDHQYGFKKDSGCSKAIYSVRNVVDIFISNRSTVNICALDLSKAFDKMSHVGLFIKLMERMVPNKLLTTLESWFNICATCIRWGNIYSRYITLKCGIRQGGVLSPYLFAVFIDDVVKLVHSSKHGCHIGTVNFSIYLYADDILIVAPSVSALQHLVRLVEKYLSNIEMTLNVKKSACIRIGPRYADTCCNITTTSGDIINWVDQIRYLGVHIVAAKKFKISLEEHVRSFYRAANNIFMKVAGCASEECLVKLIFSKCVPILLYGLEVCNLQKSQLRYLDFICTRTVMKIFKTKDTSIVRSCMMEFGLSTFSTSVEERTRKFLCRLGRPNILNSAADFT